MSRRETRLMLALCVLALAWPAAHSVLGVGAGFMYLAPALVLLFPLLAGRYVGEDRIVALAAERPPPRRVAAVGVTARRAPVIMARGGRLLAASLAVRPPPLPVAR